MTFSVASFDEAYPLRSKILLEDHCEFLENKKVLELAACKGGFTKTIASLADQVVAIEVKEEFAKEIQFPNVKVIIDDIHQCIWAMKSENFDVAICAGFLYQTAHPFYVLEGIANLDPRYVLIDTLDFNVEKNALDVRILNNINSAYNRYNWKPDCHLTLTPGKNMIGLAMDRLGYAVSVEIDKSQVPDTISDYVTSWKQSTSIWFEKKT